MSAQVTISAKQTLPSSYFFAYYFLNAFVTVLYPVPRTVTHGAVLSLLLFLVSKLPLDNIILSHGCHGCLQPTEPPKHIKLLLQLYPSMSQRHLKLKCAKVNLSSPSFLLPAFLDTVNGTNLHQIAQVRGLGMLSDSPTLPHIIQSVINPHDSGCQLSLKSSHFSPSTSPIS